MRKMPTPTLRASVPHFYGVKIAHVEKKTATFGVERKKKIRLRRWEKSNDGVERTWPGRVKLIACLSRCVPGSVACRSGRPSALGG